ncbi:AIPR family protein [Argonema antarcticum]|uniref:AIPR family protein n=1 Tax=Argonema antarcticum TaxID=2942763 RepID=UPI0020116EC4|nr:AIPR family protein [Argonema antarcticum]MCL1475350.1 AIPR family protein [Argonema antarcticum A004/B2]
MVNHKFFIPVDFVSEYGSKGENRTTTCFAVALVDSLPTDLPLTPNLRRPNKKTEVFQQILRTLRTAPERFLDRNNGIKITARSIKIEKTKSSQGVWVDLGEDKATGGIVNGAHTLAAIESAKIEGVPLKAARVKVEILCGLDDREVSTTSVAVNTATPVDTRSKLNAQGVFEPIREYINMLNEKQGLQLRIAYYQNQEGVGRSLHCSVAHVYDLLFHLDRMKHDFTKPGKYSHPKGSVSSSAIKSEAATTRLIELLPLLQDALWIEKHLYQLVQKHLEHPSVKGVSNLVGVKAKGTICLMDGTYFGFTAPVPFSLPVVAAYRVFLDEERPCDRWVAPFLKFSPILMQELWKWYREELKKEKARGNESFTSLIRNPVFWSDMCLVAQQVYRKF